MKECQKTEGASAAAKANIVRAFYDAADRLFEERNKGAGDEETVSLALRQLEEVVTQSASMEEPEFTKALPCLRQMRIFLSVGPVKQISSSMGSLHGARAS